MHWCFLTAFVCFVLYQIFEKICGIKYYHCSNILFLMYGLSITRAIEWYFYTNQDMFDFNRLGATMTWQENIIVIITTGYFLFETPIAVIRKRNWYRTLHHILCLEVTLPILYFQRSGFDALVCIWLGEFTTPFGYFICDAFDKPEKINSKWITINKIVFVSFFVLLRFIIGSYVLYRIIYSNSLLMVKIGCSLFFVVNAFLFRDMMGEARLMLNQDDPSTLKQNLNFFI